MVYLGKIILKGSIFVLALYTGYFILNTHVQAINMNSDRYRIQFGETNIGSKDTSSSNYYLNNTVGELAAGEFQSSGYIVKAGFEYIHSIIPFSFSVSNTTIDLGTLAPNIPSTDTTTLTVSFGGAGLYQVTAEEIGKLRTFSGAFTIPDTQCDGGVDTCTQSSAKPWTSASAYGFGYNMTGQDIPGDFTDATYYRPFPDRNLGDTPRVVMTNVDVGRNRQSTMTVKGNASSAQEGGTYQTVINFVATPSY